MTMDILNAFLGSTPKWLQDIKEQNENLGKSMSDPCMLCGIIPENQELLWQEVMKLKSNPPTPASSQSGE